jgi:hypothetical protein
MVAAGCATAPLAPGAAPLPEVATDRPDFTESASVVPHGHVQVETGYTFTRDEDGQRVRTEHGYPEALLRIGVGDRVELRLGQSFLTTRTAPDIGNPPSHRTAAEDLYLGAKLGLVEERGARPAMVLIPQATVPTGSASLSAGRVLPGLNLIYAWDLVPDVLSLTASTQGNLALDPEDRSYLELTQSASVGFTVSERVGAYTEWFASFAARRRAGVPAAHSVDGGFTVKVGPNVQWDIRVGAGLTREADGFFAGSGISVRY